MGTSQYPEWSGPPLLNFWQGDPVKNIPLWNWVRFPGSQRKYLVFSMETDPDGTSTVPSAPLPTGVTLTGTPVHYVTYPGSGGNNGTYTGIQFRVTDTRNGVHRTSPLTQVKIAGAIVLTPSQPANFAVVAKSASSIDVSWDAGAGGSTILAFHVYRAPSQAQGWQEISADADSVYTDTPLAADTEYWYTVAAEDVNHVFSTSTVAKPAKTFAGPPAIPVGLSAYGVDDDVIRVSWVAGTGSGTAATDHFVLYHAASAGGSYTPIDPATSPTDHDGNDPLEEVFFKVRAVDASGVFSDYSAIVSAVTKPLPKPSTPTGVRATPLSDTEIEIAYDASTGGTPPVTYKIWRRRTVSEAFAVLATDAASPYVHGSITPNKQLWYTVSAIDAAAQESGQSEIVTATTYPTPVPIAPVSVGALGISTTEIRVTWTPASTGPAAAKFYVYRAATIGGTYNKLAAEPTSSPLVDSPLSVATPYHYKIKAVDANNGESEFSAIASGTTQSLPMPDVPTSLVASTQSTSSILLAWQQGGGGTPTGYRVYRASPSNSNYAPLHASTDDSPFLDTGLQADTPYYYRVAALDSGADPDFESSQSVYATARTSAVTPSGLTFIIPSNAPSFNCAVAQLATNGVSRKPTLGDTIILSAGTSKVNALSGTRGALTISNLNASGISGTPTSGQYTQITNPANGVITIRRSTNGTTSNSVVVVSDCHYFDWHGANGSHSGNRGCGIVITYASSATTGSPDFANFFLQFTGPCDHYHQRFTEFAGGWHLDASTNKQKQGAGAKYSQDQLLPKGGGLFIDTIKILDNYVHNIPENGFYIGSNYSSGARPLKNIEVARNYLRWIGEDGFTCKNWWEGTNSIHDNDIQYVGQLPLGYYTNDPPDQRVGISVYDGVVQEVYNNRVGDCSINSSDPTILKHGITMRVANPRNETTSGYQNYVGDAVTVLVYNNVVFRASYGTGIGINVASTGDSYQYKPYINCNTVVDCVTGINSQGNDTAGSVQNNITLGNGTNISSDITGVNNITGASGETKANTFTNAATDDYTLKINRAATGTFGLPPTGRIPPTDIAGLTRTAGTSDCGAHERA